MEPTGLGAGDLLLFLVIVPIAFLPTIIAITKKHPNKTPIPDYS
jgi:hypothetical protein